MNTVPSFQVNGCTSSWTRIPRRAVSHLPPGGGGGGGGGGGVGAQMQHQLQSTSAMGKVLV